MYSVVTIQVRIRSASNYIKLLILRKILFMLQREKQSVIIDHNLLCNTCRRNFTLQNVNKTTEDHCINRQLSDPCHNYPGL